MSILRITKIKFGKKLFKENNTLLSILIKLPGAFSRIKKAIKQKIKDNIKLKINFFSNRLKKNKRKKINKIYIGEICSPIPPI
jgi:primosomal protein N''